MFSVLLLFLQQEQRLSIVNGLQDDDLGRTGNNPCSNACSPTICAHPCICIGYGDILSTGQIRCKFIIYMVTCHHVSGWNILEDDVEIEFRQRRAQSDLNVRCCGQLVFVKQVPPPTPELIYMFRDGHAFAQCPDSPQLKQLPPPPIDSPVALTRLFSLLAFDCPLLPALPLDLELPEL